MSQQIASLSALLALIGLVSLPSRAPAQSAGPEPETEAAILRVAFGSCFHQDKDASIFQSVLATEPGLFVFLGDNIYGDTQDMSVMRAKYAKLFAVPAVQTLRATCPILATWDDHDYGTNDGGASYPARDASQRVFLESFGVPEDREPWSRPGIYDAWTFGPPGKRLQVILLDTRYFRGDLVRHDLDLPRILGPYGENRDPSATLLGEPQWTWLEAKLREPADLRIIASSIQVLPVDHRWERWENLPLERARLFRLLQSTGARNTVFLSGDRHLSEIMQLPATDPAGPGWPVLEITSSGLNQAGGTTSQEPNRYRLGDNYRGANFGLLTIDWAPPFTVRAAIHDRDGQPALTQSIQFPTTDTP